MCFLCRFVLTSNYFSLCFTSMLSHFFFRLENLFCVPDFSQVIYVWQCVQLFQNIKQTLRIVFTNLGNSAFFIVRITKNNGAGGTSLRTRSLYFIGTNWPVFHFCFQLTCLCTLNAERTFFHYTAAACNHIRIQYHPG